MRGFETDGENAVYLCIPEKFYRRIQARKVQARKRQAQRIDSMVRGHAAQIRGMLGSDSQVTVTGSTEIKLRGEIKGRSKKQPRTPRG